MRPLNLDRSFSEEEGTDRCPLLVGRANRMARKLSGWGWGTIEIKYKYGKRGTGSAHAWITAERGEHGVTIEYQYRLNSRSGPTVKMVGGFWDGGPFRNETDLVQLAKPLGSAYNPKTRSPQGEGKMTEAKPRPSKRVSKKAAAASAPTSKRVSKRAAAKPEPEPVEEESPKRGRRRGRGPWENYDDVRAQVVDLRDNQSMNWADIAEKVDLTAGMATFLYASHNYGDEFHGLADPQTIATERDENNLSWSAIEAKYWITRGEAWDLYAEAGGDHFTSDIGKGGRYITRDPEVVEQRRADRAEARKAAKPAGARRGRRKAFTGFDADTPDDDIINAVDGRTITWTKPRGGGEDTAKVMPETADLKTDRTGKRSLVFNDGKKSRTVYVTGITAIK